MYIRDPEVNATQDLIQLDLPGSPVSPVAPGIPPVERKVQNNMGYHQLPDSPKSKHPALPVHENNDNAPEGGGKGPSSSSTAAYLQESLGHLPQIPYSELLTATNNWDRRNILGKGGFGTVYKGIWKNTSVAIKRMEQRANHAYVESQMKQSLGELRCLNSCRHDNILPLYGFSMEGEHPSLVYQYMVNGSLEDKLLCRVKAIIFFRFFIFLKFRIRNVQLLICIYLYDRHSIGHLLFIGSYGIRLLVASCAESNFYTPLEPNHSSTGTSKVQIFYWIGISKQK